MIHRLWLIIEGILILTLIFLLFYGLFVWSANHGGLETVKGTLIFGIAGILFISPFIDKTINLWGRLKLTKQYNDVLALASLINFGIIVSGTIVFLWFSVNGSNTFDFNKLWGRLWALVTS